MDTLHDRLADLADAAPIGGSPASELWDRGRRAHRQRAALLGVGLLVLAAIGTGVGVRLADKEFDQARVVPARPGLGFTLPLNYPGAEPLPRLGATPGPLAAIWVTGRVGQEPQVVGLVAETGTFGRLSLDLAQDHSDVTGEPAGYYVQLSADGRLVAYLSAASDLVVHDLATGEDVRPGIAMRPGFSWIDATHLVGHDGSLGGDADGWIWTPSEGAKRINYYSYSERPVLWPVNSEPVFDPGLPACSIPTVADQTGTIGIPAPGTPGWSEFEVPQLCDVLSVNTYTLLGHDPIGQVVALDVSGGPPFSDPALRHVVVIQGAPQIVTVAADLVEQAIVRQGGTS